MAKIKRKIIEIDEEKCNGCGLCIAACPEGALEIIDGKARLVKENFCDGFGACLGDCPEDALHIFEREVDEYDEDGVVAHIKETSPELLEKHMKHLDKHCDELESQKTQKPVFSCPSSRSMQWDDKAKPSDTSSVKMESTLRQWPIQLHLVSPGAPYFKNADLLIVADCVPFAHANFHAEFLKGNPIAIGCPKLDDVNAYEEKITQIIEQGDVRSVTVLYMEVPCCFGLVNVAKEALAKSNKKIPFETVVIGIKGDVVSREKG